MISKRKPFNPFYILLLLAGIAFAITACAYGVMTVRQLSASRVSGYDFDRYGENEPQDFNALVDKHGANAMIIELILLGVGTAGAIAYDQHLDKRLAVETPDSEVNTPKPI
jgi:hypothetical protein